MQQVYTRDQVVDALQTVLKDAKFAAAPQMSAFLRFVVMQTLDGKADRIKAYTVAVDALGKPATFDPQNDPSVRVLAKRLRDTLNAYYERTRGHTVILRLHCGSYIPVFEPSTDAQVESAAPVSLEPVVHTSNVTPLNRPAPETKEIVEPGLSNDNVMYADNKLAKP